MHTQNTRPSFLHVWEGLGTRLVIASFPGSCAGGGGGGMKESLSAHAREPGNEARLVSEDGTVWL